MASGARCLDLDAIGGEEERGDREEWGCLGFAGGWTGVCRSG